MAANPMGGFWARLTPRERIYLLVLVLVFFTMGTIVLMYLRGNAIRDAENQITEIRAALDQVYTRGAVYKEKLEQKKKREASLSSKTLAFAPLIEDASKVSEEIKPTNEEEIKAQELGNGLVKRAYKFNLRGVTLQDLVKFIVKLESKPGHVILTESLYVRSPSTSEDRLNADVQIATWERREEEAAEGDEESKEEEEED
jgi:hypothetical protein